MCEEEVLDCIHSEELSGYAGWLPDMRQMCVPLNHDVSLSSEISTIAHTYDLHTVPSLYTLTEGTDLL